MSAQARITMYGGFGAIVVTMGVVILPYARAEVSCIKLEPAASEIEVFASSTAGHPDRTIQRDLLGSVCSLGEKNSRYHIRVQEQDVWIPTAQLRGQGVWNPQTTPFQPAGRTPAGTAGVLTSQPSPFAAKPGTYAVGAGSAPAAKPEPQTLGCKFLAGLC
jgi:hypothetical protein